MFLRRSRQQKYLVGMTGLLFVVAGIWLNARLARSQDSAARPTQADQRLQTLQQQLGQGLVTESRLIAGQTETPPLRFIGTDKNQPIAVAPDGVAINAVGSEPEQLARTFLRQYGDLFGLQNEASDLHTTRTWSVADETVGRRNFVRFQQVYQGVPVIGGDFTVQSTPNGILSASGRLLTAHQLQGLTSVAPQLTAEQAGQTALTAVAKAYQVDTAQLTSSPPSLMVYNPIVFQNQIALTRLVWQTTVTDTLAGEINEMVLVDAQHGGIALHFNQSEAVLNRTIYDNQNSVVPGLPGNGPVREEGGAATGIRDVDLAYDYAGKTYDFYWSNFGRDSLDGRGLALRSTVRYCKFGARCPLANAFWNDHQMVYGEGYAAADDVVGHEFSHGFTQYESHLFYYMQSGAINEALSDIFGEYIDLTDGVGNDATDVRWLMGEELASGAIRNLQDPARGLQPDSMSSALYQCGTKANDNGGVHINSGVANKTAFLMTDGGTLNGVTVQGLGITKAAQIWYETATNLLNSASDYQDLSSALPQACTNLVGTLGITSADCQQVRKAISATQMNQPPTACAAQEAPVCPAGQQPSYLFQDNLEEPASGQWQVWNFTGPDNWYYPQNNNPSNADLTYATSGQYNFVGDDLNVVADGAIQMTQDVTLPAGSTPYLRFNHAYEFESSNNGLNQDGGLLEYSTDQGATWQSLDTFVADNGYTGAIQIDGGNPLAGRNAFTGSTHGYGSSRFNLAPLAGRNVRVRFRMGTDLGNYYGGKGWFIDDIGIYTCGAPTATYTPTPTNTPTPTSTPTSTPTNTPTPTVTPVPPSNMHTVTIKLDVVPDGASNFHFDSTFGGFYLDDSTPQDGDAYSNSKSVVLPAGESTVTAGATTNWVLAAITCMPGNAAVVSLAHSMATINTSASDVTCIFTEQRRANILVRTYNDLNGSGTKNSSESALSGETITVNSLLLATPLQQTTNDLGKTDFTLLVPGSYTVCEVMQAGWVNTQPGGSTPCRTITLQPGVNTTVYFGNRQSSAATVGMAPIDETFVTLAPAGTSMEEATQVDTSAWFQTDLATPDNYFTDVGATGSVPLNNRIYLPAVRR